MNYKDFSIADWAAHLSGALEDNAELDMEETQALYDFLMHEINFRHKAETVISQLREDRDRHKERWDQLKETVIELHDNDGTGTQQDACKFLANYMGILEGQVESVKEFLEECEEELEL